MGKILVSKINDNAVLPFKAHNDDAGWDVVSCEEITIPAFEQRIVHTGIKINDIDFGGYPVVIQVWSRSGLDSKYGLHVGAGIIDPGYRGEILVLVKNMSQDDYTIKIGDKIAQLVILPLAPVDGFYIDNNITFTDRMDKGGISEASKE